MIIIIAKNNSQGDIIEAVPFESTSSMSSGTVLAGATISGVPFEVTSEITVEQVNSISIQGAAVLYYFILTGQEDGLEDIEIPMNSFQSRLRNTDPTYLQVVLPGVDYAQEIDDRQNGTMRIDVAYKIGEEVVLRSTIIRADLEDVMLYEGPESSRIVLVGHRSETYTNKSILLNNSNYRFVNNGFLRHRLSEPNIYLKPGDTVTIGDDTFDANVISYYISINRSTMEVGEQ